MNGKQRQGVARDTAAAAEEREWDAGDGQEQVAGREATAGGQEAVPDGQEQVAGREGMDGSDDGTGEPCFLPEGYEHIDPLYDEVFVRVFGSPDSLPATKSLVDAVLVGAGMEPLGEVERIIGERKVMKGSVGLRTARLDVELVCADTVVDIEAQRDDMSRMRPHFYAARALVENTGKGTRYEDMRHVVVIVLLDAGPLLPEDTGYIQVKRMMFVNDPHVEDDDPDDGVSFVFVELSKIRGRSMSLEDALHSELTAWMYTLTQGFLSNEGDGATAEGRQNALRFERHRAEPVCEAQGKGLQSMEGAA